MDEKRLYWFNIVLIIVALLTAISAIQLEVASGEEVMGINFYSWVWSHVIISLICMVGVMLHLYFHWGEIRDWVKEIKRLRRKQTKWLVWFSLFTFLTGLVAALLFWSGHDHNPIGGVHGKFGLIALAIVISHLLKRIKWFKGRSKGGAFYPRIDQKRCVGCRKCEKVCPAYVLKKGEGGMFVDKKIFCQQCRKCVMICSSGAIAQ